MVNSTQKFNPFFINSNIITDFTNIKTIEDVLSACGGNTGNLYITYSLVKECLGSFKDIHHIQNIYNYNFSQSEKDIDYINNEATHVFLILQDQIRIEESYGLKLPYENIKNFIKRLNKPVIICGLGTNSFVGLDPNFDKMLSDELKDFVRFLSEHSIEIGVRGNFTKFLLKKLGVKNVSVVGCPSYFETGRERLIVKKELSSLQQAVVTSGDFHKDLVKNHKIMQDTAEQKYIKAMYHYDFSGEYNKQEMINLLKNRYHIFSDIKSWKNFISNNFNFVIGCRLHGTIIALNSGVPAICCNTDSRAYETCNFLGVPYFPNINSDINIMRLYEGLDVDKINKKYSELYENYERFLNKNGVKLLDVKKDDIKIAESAIYINKPRFYYKFLLKILSNMYKYFVTKLLDIKNRISDKIKNLQRKIKNLQRKIKNLFKYIPVLLKLCS